MKKIILILIILLAFFLRIYRIGLIPKTLYGDEQAFAWNAYSILKTGADEYGTPYPLQFRSFEDYKSPIPVYLLVPVFRLFGMNSWSIRIPVTVFSVLTVLVSYHLFRFFSRKKIALLSSFLFAISPWHVHLSRGYFEATISLFFFVTGVYFSVKSRGKLPALIMSMIFFVMTIYSYFTPRILLLLFLPFLMLFAIRTASRPDRKKVTKNYLFSFGILVVLSLPLFLATVKGTGFSRFSKLTENMNNIVTSAVITERGNSLLPGKWNFYLHNKATVWFRIVRDNYFEHLSFNFWYIFGDNSLRYFLGKMGLFHYWEMPFFLSGLYYLFRKNRKAFIFFTAWILLSPIPASLVGRPFAVRSLAMLPAPFIITASGMIYLFSDLKKRLLLYLPLVAVVSSSLFIILIRYYFEYPVYAATWWGWENYAALEYASDYEDKYENIFISDFYTGAPLAFAVYKQIDPLVYRQAVNNPVYLLDGRKMIKMGKYFFGSLDIDKNRLEKDIIPPKSLYIGRPEEADSPDTINSPEDKRVIFKIFRKD